MRGSSLVARRGAFLALLLVATACGGDASGDPERSCEINTELEQLGPSQFPPEDVRRDVGEPRIAMALRVPLVLFEFEDVALFADGLEEWLDVAPAEIRPSIQTLSDLYTPLFVLADSAASGAEPGDLTASLERAFGDEAAAAGFAVEEWVDANCSR